MVKNNSEPHYVGHRERLREKFRAGSKLPDYEVLELLLMYAIPRTDVKPLAKDLLNKFGNIRAVIHADINDLMSIPGVAENTATLLKVIHDLMMRSFVSELRDAPIFQNMERLREYVKSELHGKTVEEFHVMYLNSARQLILDETHATGTINWATIYPREITKRALNLGAAAIILVHNHPTGLTSFSSADIEMTISLRDALSHQDIDLLDHLLVSGPTVYSARELYLFK